MIPDYSKLIKNIIISLIFSALAWSTIDKFVIDISILTYFFIEIIIVISKILSSFIKQKYGILSLPEKTKNENING